MDFSALRSLQYDNGFIVIPGVSSRDDANCVLDIFLSAVLDGHVPITKIIGFALETPEVKNNQNSMRFVGSGYTLESVPEIANQLGKLIVLGWDATTCKRFYQLSGTEGSRGDRAIPVVTGPNLVLAPNTADGANLHFMQTGVQICRFNNSKVVMKVVLDKNTGKHDMAATSRIALINDMMGQDIEGTRSQFFFMNANYSLVDSIRIIPPKGGEYFSNGSVRIKVKFLNGMTFDIFKQMWEDMHNDATQERWLRKRLQTGG